MDTKITGYSLLATGLVIIFLALFSVYQVFTGATKPVKLFNFPGISMDLGKLIDTSQVPTEMRPKDSTQELISAQMLNDSSNLALHLLFMGFVASAGFKIGSLGISLLRPINVKVNQEKTRLS